MTTTFDMAPRPAVRMCSTEFHRESASPDFVKDAEQHPFKLNVVQCFHGPCELTLQSHVLSFGYSNKNKGAISMSMMVNNEHLQLSIAFSMLEQITFLPPAEGHNAAVAFHFQRKSFRKLINTFGTAKQIDDILRATPTMLSFAQKQLVCVLSHWSPTASDQYIMMGTSPNGRTASWRELPKLFNEWIIPTRDLDLISSLQRKGKSMLGNYDTRFYDEITYKDWLEFLEKFGLREVVPDVDTSDRIKHYEHGARSVGRGMLSGQLATSNRPYMYNHSAVEVQALERMHIDPAQAKLYSLGEQTVKDYLRVGSKQKRPRSGDLPMDLGSPTKMFAVGGYRGQIERNVSVNADRAVLHQAPIDPLNELVSSLNLSKTDTEPTAAIKGNCGASGSNNKDFAAEAPTLSVETNGSANKSLNAVISPTQPAKKLVKPKKKQQVEMLTIEDEDEEDKQVPDIPTTQALVPTPVGKLGKLVPKGEMLVNGDSKLVKYLDGKDSVTVHFEDVRVLAHGEMLNDTIVDFYIKFVLTQLTNEQDPTLYKRVHVFNTFFYPKLVEKATNPGSLFATSKRGANLRFQWVRKNFASVKNWTKKADLFNKDYLIFPVNDDLHWYLVIVIRPKLAVQDVEMTDADVEASRVRGAKRDDPATHIIVFDSLQDKNDLKRCAIGDIIRDYLECEFDDKKPMTGRLVRTHLQLLHPLDLPRQKNYVDCGIYLLAFVEAFFSKSPSHVQLCEPNGSWANWYPCFEDVDIVFMRTKIARQLKKLCLRNTWDLLCEYEQSRGSGLTVLTEDATVDEARRPRRHSCSRVGNSARHEKFIARSQSEPPETSRCPPPRGNASSHPFV